MQPVDHVTEAARRIASAIERRDTTALRTLLAPGFIHRSHGGTASDADAFIRAIEQIPGSIRFVRVEDLSVDLCPTGALVTGFQRAQVAVGDQVIDEHRGFVDWFVRAGDGWRIQAAVDLPARD